MYEAVFTPDGKLNFHVGWNTWDYEEHRQLADSIDSINVAQAQAFDPKDKADIDQLVLERYSDFAAANATAKLLVSEAFVRTTRDALEAGKVLLLTQEESTDGNDIEGKVHSSLKGGSRPLYDERIVALYEAKRDKLMQGEAKGLAASNAFQL
jgi:hypothetical protein